MLMVLDVITPQDLQARVVLEVVKISYNCSKMLYFQIHASQI